MHALSGRVVVWVGGKPTLIDDLRGAPLLVAEDQLPVAVDGTEVLELTPVGRTPGTFRRSPSRAASWDWNPFGEEANGPEDVWVGRVSYGCASLLLEEAGGERVLVTIRVVPSVLTGGQIGAMKGDVARYSSALLRTWRDGRTWSEAVKEPIVPSPVELLAGLERDVRALLPVLLSIARSPMVGFAAHGRPEAGAGIATATTIDVYENRVLVAILRRWGTLLTHCANLCDLEARALDLQVEFVAHGDGGTAASNGWVREAQASASAHREREEVARTLVRALRSVLERLQGVRAILPPFSRTPRLHLDARYRQVLDADARLRQDGGDTSDGVPSTLSDARASSIYETWAVMELVAALLADGWRGEGTPWLVHGTWQRFAVRVPRGSPWRFTQGAEVLDVTYEPVARRVKVSGKGGRARAIKRLSDLGGAVPDLYTYLPAVTPDVVFDLVAADGRRALGIGDMVYAPTSDGHPGGSVPSGQLEGILRKAPKVETQYARAMFRVLDGRRAVLADERCSFVIYPGHPASEVAVAAALHDAGLHVEPIALLPVADPGPRGPDGGDEVSAQRRVQQLRALLDAMRDCARDPIDLGDGAMGTTSLDQ